MKPLAEKADMNRNIMSIKVKDVAKAVARLKKLDYLSLSKYEINKISFGDLLNELKKNRDEIMGRFE